MKAGKIDQSDIIKATQKLMQKIQADGGRRDPSPKSFIGSKSGSNVR